MVLPVARTRDEAHLYMDLHPCPKCGRVDATWDSGLAEAGGGLARRYSGRCPGCGTDREFVFRLPDRPLVPGPGDVVLFGGPEPSELLDAGEWLWVTDLCVRDGVRRSEPDGPAGGRLSPEAVQSLATALAAVDEALKFVPDGADAVPESAIWSRRGRELWRAEPDRFQRRALVALRDSCRDSLDRATPS